MLVYQRVLLWYIDIEYHRLALFISLRRPTWAMHIERKNIQHYWYIQMFFSATWAIVGVWSVEFSDMLWNVREFIITNGMKGVNTPQKKWRLLDTFVFLLGHRDLGHQTGEIVDQWWLIDDLRESTTKVGGFTHLLRTPKLGSEGHPGISCVYISYIIQCHVRLSKNILNLPGIHIVALIWKFNSTFNGSSAQEKGHLGFQQRYVVMMVATTYALCIVASQLVFFFYHGYCSISR